MYLRNPMNIALTTHSFPINNTILTSELSFANLSVYNKPAFKNPDFKKIKYSTAKKNPLIIQPSYIAQFLLCVHKISRQGDTSGKHM